jgi:tRNA modification GTPase
VQALLAALGRLRGFRPASPGEFTRRAFTNGKMNLLEVEGLADLLNADTEAQRTLALAQMAGGLSALYGGWRASLVKALAHVEAYIDFQEDEEDVHEGVYGAVEDRVRTLATAMRRHLDDNRRGEIIAQGLRIAIVGPPNAGKSSLLNALVRRQAAIVSSIPGTTRDVVEARLDLGGVGALLADTAGIRARAADAVEEEGMRRAAQRAEDAHLRLCMFDAATALVTLGDLRAGRVQPLGLPDSLAELVTSDSILLLNKCDTAANVPPSGLLDPCADHSAAPDSACVLHPDLAARIRGNRPPGAIAAAGARQQIYAISCVTRTGLDALLDGLSARVSELVWTRDGEGAGSGGDTLLITRARHRHQVEQCLGNLERFLERPEAVDLAAEELRLAVRALAALTGRVDVEDLLDVVFSDFCIGK